MAGVAERTLALKLIGDVSGLRKDLQPAQRQLGQFTKGLASWGKALAGGVVIGGVERLAGALGDAWQGYRSGEKAAAQLRKTWKNLGLQGKSYRSVLDKVTASTLALGTSDDEAVEAFSRSLSRTRDYQQSLRELAIAQDLVASGAAGNLEAAFKLIQQAGKGSARVVDRFGLTAKTSAGRIRELGDQVKGTAKAKARLDPLGVLFNRMAEDTEAIVGAFAKGDFKGVVKGLQGLGETVADALFGPKGSDNIRNSKKAGLVNQFGGWASQLAKGIQTELGKVDWAKTISDTLNSAISTLSTAGENGTLSTLGTIGAALAAGIFAVDLFVTAATTMFKAPGWAAKKIVEVGALVVGRAFAGAMFLAEMFTGVAADMFRGITKLPVRLVAGLRALGRLMGTPLGLGILAGIGGAFTANAILDMLASKLDEAFGTKNFSEARRQQTQHGAGPLDMFARVFEELFSGLGFAGGTKSAPPGWHMVGEKGPELMRFRGGEQVIPHGPSMAMAGGSTVNVAITVNAPVAADGARAGAEIARYLDQWLGRGGRFRYRPVGGTT